jgi:hypothetical protein
MEEGDRPRPDHASGAASTATVQSSVLQALKGVTARAAFVEVMTECRHGQA